MPCRSEQLLDEALTLPAAERRRLVEALLDSIPPESAEAIEVAWLEEARRRADRIERGEEQTLDGELAVTELLVQLDSLTT